MLCFRDYFCGLLSGGFMGIGFLVVSLSLLLTSIIAAALARCFAWKLTLLGGSMVVTIFLFIQALLSVKGALSASSVPRSFYACLSLVQTLEGLFAMLCITGVATVVSVLVANARCLKAQSSVNAMVIVIALFLLASVELLRYPLRRILAATDTLPSVEQTSAKPAVVE